MLRAFTLFLPAIMPSWRFFDVIAPSPRIEYSLRKTQDEAEEQLEWSEMRPRPQHISLPQALKRLLWNPHWNESLFLVSCAERLMQQPTEHSVQEIITRLRADLNAQNTKKADALYLQFRLVFVYREGESIKRQVAYRSEAFPFLEREYDDI